MFFILVMPGLVPGIHVFQAPTKKTWMAGTSPAMTAAFFESGSQAADVCMPPHGSQRWRQR
jgi:hypothetical protein